MSVPRTGIAASVPYVFGIFGSLSGGWICDKLLVRAASPMLSRKLPIVAGLFGMALFTAVAALSQSTAVALAAITVAMFFGNVSSATSWALTGVAAPANAVASLGGMQNFGGYLGGALAPVVTGIIVQGTHSFVPALLVGAGVGFISALIYLVVVRDPIIRAA